MKNQKIHVKSFIGRRPKEKKTPNDSEKKKKKKNIEFASSLTSRRAHFFRTIENLNEIKKITLEGDAINDFKGVNGCISGIIYFKMEWAGKDSEFYFGYTCFKETTQSFSLILLGDIFLELQVVNKI